MMKPDQSKWISRRESYLIYVSKARITTRNDKERHIWRQLIKPNGN